MSDGFNAQANSEFLAVSIVFNAQHAKELFGTGVLSDAGIAVEGFKGGCVPCATHDYDALMKYARAQRAEQVEGLPFLWVTLYIPAKVAVHHLLAQEMYVMDYWSGRPEKTVGFAKDVNLRNYPYMRIERKWTDGNGEEVIKCQAMVEDLRLKKMSDVLAVSIFFDEEHALRFLRQENPDGIDKRSFNGRVVPLAPQSEDESVAIIKFARAYRCGRVKGVPVLLLTLTMPARVAVAHFLQGDIYVMHEKEGRPGKTVAFTKSVNRANYPFLTIVPTPIEPPLGAELLRKGLEHFNR